MTNPNIDDNGLVEESSEVEAISFVIRIWRDKQSDRSEIRGWVEHVQGHQRIPFQGWDRLIAILATHIRISPTWQERIWNLFTNRHPRQLPP